MSAFQNLTITESTGRWGDSGAQSWDRNNTRMLPIGEQYNTLVEREELKTRERGANMERAIDFIRDIIQVSRFAGGNARISAQLKGGVYVKSPQKCNKYVLL